MSSVIGFDYGQRRIGIAIGNKDLQTANPLTAILVPPSGIPWDEITTIIEEWQPSTLIVGTVTHATQNNNAIQKQVQNFCKILNTRYHLPVETVDESNTSVKAYEILKDLRSKGQRKKINKMDIDKASAAIILDSWFSFKDATKLK
ncbi:MAG: Holliday junction resolvase RuvX [Gammaproteobacteria bacterium]|nr:MAG: Holliday junction resolvase RuvX [Gammaproteobacteria bacterium]